MVERDLDHLGDLVGRRPEVGPSLGCGDDWIYTVGAWRGVEGRQRGGGAPLGWGGVAGFWVGLAAGPRIRDHLDLGLEAWLWPVEPTLEEDGVEAKWIPI